jgi:hypothetical protein
MSLHAYHPETQASVMVEQGQLDHMRASGWLLWSEYEANEVARAEREAAASKSAAPAAKTSKEN